MIYVYDIQNYKGLHPDYMVYIHQFNKKKQCKPCKPKRNQCMTLNYNNIRIKSKENGLHRKIL